ncbi:hypothetical protein CIG75_06560 [Tumebacillus algifaecis]|uniref:Condensation domain-containing protein n=1 Tax=Tumebacillus algifaecis TaxID=1214604 RepID=A0A223CZS7_9BACL|nr:condensation domain-containing protein [Tumebacillus algifaecis]ASS74664.1 hypothetical protein CIG75_06560 [Tumebacillus algifaecis]
MDDLQKRLAALPPDKRKLLEMALKQKGIDVSKAAPQKERIKKRGHDGPSPLSIDQLRLWESYQETPDDPRHNNYNAQHIKGQLDPDALLSAYQEIVRRHEAWRTVFRVIDGKPMQVILPQLEVEMERIDLRHLPLEERRETANRLMVEATRVPFDVTEAPLFRIQLFRLDEEEHIKLWVTHHLITDRITYMVTDQELLQFYMSEVMGNPLQLALPDVQYADWTEWQHNYLQGDVLADLTAFWKGQLGGASLKLDLPTDHPRPAVMSYEGKRKHFRLPSDLFQGINLLAKNEGVTPFMVFLAAYDALLHLYSGQEDIVVGTPYVNRSRLEVKNTVGYFLTPIVFRLDVHGEMTFRGLLQKVKEVNVAVHKHADIPFGLLVDLMELAPDQSRHPIFQAMFVHVDVPTVQVLEGMPLSIVDLDIDGSTSKYDIVFAVLDANEEPKGFWEFNADLFEQETIEQIVSDMERLLRAVLLDPSQKLADLPLRVKEGRAI